MEQTQKGTTKEPLGTSLVSCVVKVQGQLVDTLGPTLVALASLRVRVVTYMCLCRTSAVRLTISPKPQSQDLSPKPRCRSKVLLLYLEVHCTYSLLSNCNYNPTISGVTVVMGLIFRL